MRVLSGVLFAVVWLIWMVVVSSVGGAGRAWSTSEVMAVAAVTAALLALGWMLVVQPGRSRRQPPSGGGLPQ